jgi:hypothetical protein
VTQTRLIAVPAFLVAMLLATAGTAASAQNVPPGVSGANQYTETLPGPGGNDAAGGGHLAGGGTGVPKSTAQTLGAKNAHKLEALGPEGKAAAELATQSSPAATSSSSSSNSTMATGHKDGKHAGQGAGGKAGSSNSSRSSGAQGGSSGVQQVLGQITGTGGSNSGGMNWLLPLLIGASVVVAATYIFARRRPPRPQD